MATAEEARNVILSNAPAMIAGFPEGPEKSRIEMLYEKSAQKPKLSTFAIKQLSLYAETMHRNPPSRRTLAKLLEWISGDK